MYKININTLEIDEIEGTEAFFYFINKEKKEEKVNITSFYFSAEKLTALALEYVNKANATIVKRALMFMHIIQEIQQDSVVDDFNYYFYNDVFKAGGFVNIMSTGYGVNFKIYLGVQKKSVFIKEYKCSDAYFEHVGALCRQLDKNKETSKTMTDIIHTVNLRMPDLMDTFNKYYKS